MKQKDFNKLRGEARELAIHRNDCPKLHDFFRKYALGSLEGPSCFGCGHKYFNERSIQHLELSDIYLCKYCALAIQQNNLVKELLEITEMLDSQQRWGKTLPPEIQAKVDAVIGKAITHVKGVL